MNLQFSFRFRTYVLQHTPFSTRSFGKIVGLVPTGYIDPKSGNSLPFLILKKEVFLSSYFRLRMNIHSKMNDSVNKLHKFKEKVKKNGAPEEIRTPDPLLRRQLLYPAELQALGRGSKIRTYDHSLPKRVRYQTALYPEDANIKVNIINKQSSWA